MASQDPTYIFSTEPIRANGNISLGDGNTNLSVVYRRRAGRKRRASIVQKPTPVTGDPVRIGENDISTLAKNLDCTGHCT